MHTFESNEITAMLFSFAVPNFQLTLQGVKVPFP